MKLKMSKVSYRKVKTGRKKNGTFAKQTIKKVHGYQAFQEQVLSDTY